MAGLSDYAARAVLAHIAGKASIFTLPTVYMAVFTAVGTDGGTGFVEPSGGGYARAATNASTWNSASGSSPSQITNANAITFPTATASWGSVLGWGLLDAPVGGNILWDDFMGPYSYLPFYCTAASPGVLSVASHGYQSGDSVVVTSEYGGSLPTTPGSWSGVLTVANPNPDQFSLGVNTTSSGEGMVRKILVQSVGTGTTLTMNPGSLILQLS